MEETPLYKKYKTLQLDGQWIGLEKGEETTDWFCTPVGAKVIGWDNSIHYCFIDGFGEMVFCVNPETCCDTYVYPLAKNFRDFLGLILTTANTNTMQQVILWNRETYEEFLQDPNTVEYATCPETKAVLAKIQAALQIEPIADPFTYIKELQQNFVYDKIIFTNAYYDTLGLDRPDGTEYACGESEDKTELTAHVSLG